MAEKLLLISQLSLKTVSLMAVSPLFWITLWVTYRYYTQYEWDKASAERLALASSIQGIGAGFLAICLITFLGLTLRPSLALLCAGPASMLLSLLHPRFFCMAYGAGLTIAVFWLLHQPVDAAGLMSLVAVLHLTESILVLLFGGRHTVTVYQPGRTKLLSGSGIYRFWPVPICLIIAVSSENSSIAMPDWWPLLPMGQNEILCGLLPLAVTLGYSDRSNQIGEIHRRRLQNGMLILSYALILLLLSLLSIRSPWLQGTSLAFMVLGHEAIVNGRKWMPHEKSG